MKKTSPHEHTLDLAQQYGISSDQFIDEIDGNKHEGPVILSADPEESHYKPAKFKIENVDEFKKLAGIADEKYIEGEHDYFHDIPPECTDEMMRNIEANMAHICLAHDAYLFGNSRQVASYKRVLNKIYYPLEVSAFLVKGNLVATPSSPIIIRKGHGVVSADKVIIEKGSYIKWETGGKMTANEFINGAPVTNPELAEAAPPPPTYDYGSIGQSRPKATSPNQPSPQPQAGQGKGGVSGKSSCDTPAQTGHPGLPGQPGGHGDPGGRGGDSSPVNLSVTKITGNPRVATMGGKGGDGGDGAQGGQGGQGGEGGNAVGHCSQGPGGTGGIGGKGGDAGKGGVGGDGKDIIITYTSGSPQWTITAGQAIGGEAGKRGEGGPGGPGGPGDPTGGSDGNGPHGASNTGGANGKAGKVIINGKVVPPTHNSL